MDVLEHEFCLDMLARWINCLAELEHFFGERLQKTLCPCLFLDESVCGFPIKKEIVYKCQVLSPCVNFKLVTKNLLCSFVVADSECESLLEASEW